MAILPEGFALPPLPYLVGLLVGAGAVGWTVARRRPAVTTPIVLAFAPWMVFGSAVHVLYVRGALPAVSRPLGGAPAVYVAVGVAGVGTWLALDAVLDEGAVVRGLAAAGGVLATGAVATVGTVGVGSGSLSPTVPAVGLVVAAALTGIVWAGLARAVPDVRATGALGAFVLFAHTLDGVSTAAGVDLLGFGERTPLSKVIIEFAAGLPTDPVLGAGWLFVAVKLVIASLVVWLFADLMREEPTRSRLLLGFVAAVGLGPAVHNLLLFSVATPA
jgi:uncharacterized membrane protein